MRTFAYRGFRHGGAACAGLVEALDTKDAREKLAAQGVFAERLDAAATGSRGRRWRAARFGRARRGEFYRELGTLLGAGLPLLAALDVILQTPELGASATLLAAVRDRVRDGHDLSHAMSEVVPDLTSFEKAALVAGARAGNMEAVLVQLADYSEEQEQAREHLKTALIYPAIVLALAAVVAVGLLGVMLPALSRLLTEARVPLPPLTTFMLAVGHYTGRLGIPLLAAGIVLCALYAKKLRSDEVARQTWERRILRVPGLGPWWGNVIGDRFCHTMAMLLRGGVQMVEGMELAAPATGSAWVAALLRQGAESVRHGQSVANALRAVPPLGASLPGWVHAGEVSGQVERIFDRAGKRYRAQWQRALRRAVNVVEPVLILAVGMLVLVVALSVLLPILSLNQSLQ